MDEQHPEWAKEFTPREKWLRAGLYSVLFGVLVLILYVWFIPWMERTIPQAPCYTLWGYSGLSLVWYVTFVGLPLFYALLVMVTTYPTAVRILRDGRFPAKHTKVYKPTRIVRGRKAGIRAFAILLAPLLLVAIAIWGSFKVSSMPVSDAQFDYSQCPAQSRIDE